METLKLTAAVAGYARLLPGARAEIDRWRALALLDPEVAAIAVGKIDQERRNIESAVFFAMLAPRPERRRVVSAIVCFQLLYELLDGLNEQTPTIGAGLRLHGALLEALAEIMTAKYDSPYARGLVAGCGLKGSPTMLAAAIRIGQAQALNHAGIGLRGWALRRSSGPWWETAAAGISSLDILAMIATPPSEHPQIVRAYREVRALSALLDALVDLPEDRATGSHNWLDHYPSASVAGDRIVLLAEHATENIARLDQPLVHHAVLAGLLAHNIVKLDSPDARMIGRRLTRAVKHTATGTRLLRLISD